MVKEETSDPTATARILVAVKYDRRLDGDNHPFNCPIRPPSPRPFRASQAPITVVRTAWRKFPVFPTVPGRLQGAAVLLETVTPGRAQRSFE